MENRIIFVGRLRDVNELERVGDALGIKDYSDFVRTEREEIPYLMPEDVEPKSLVDKMKPLSDNFNSKEVTVEEKYDIKDRGTVWIMDVKANGLPDTFEGQRSMLGHLLREKGTDEVYEVYGVNLPAVKDNGERKCEFLEALVTFKSRIK